MNNRIGERRVGAVADWHTAKMFTIIQVVVLLSGMAGGIWYLADMRTDQEIISADVARHEREILSIQRDRITRDNKLDSTLQEMKRDNQLDNQRLEDKMDRIMLHILRSDPRDISRSSLSPG